MILKGKPRKHSWNTINYHHNQIQTQAGALTVIHAPNMADRKEMGAEFYDQLQQTQDDPPHQDMQECHWTFWIWRNEQ